MWVELVGGWSIADIRMRLQRVSMSTALKRTRPWPSTIQPRLIREGPLNVHPSPITPMLSPYASSLVESSSASVPAWLSPTA